MAVYFNEEQYNFASLDEVRFNGSIYWYKSYPLHLYVQHTYILQDSDNFDLLDSENNQLCSLELGIYPFYKSIICDLVVSDEKEEFSRRVTSTIDGALFDIPFRNKYIVKIYQDNTLIGTYTLDTTKNKTDYLILIES